jgi:hypothetical protein
MCVSFVFTGTFNSNGPDQSPGGYQVGSCTPGPQFSGACPTDTLTCIRESVSVFTAAHSSASSRMTIHVLVSVTHRFST